MRWLCDVGLSAHRPGILLGDMALTRWPVLLGLSGRLPIGKAVTATRWDPGGADQVLQALGSASSSSHILLSVG